MANQQELRMIAALKTLREPCDAMIARTATVGAEGEKLIQEMEALGRGERTKAIVAAVDALREDLQRLRAAIDSAFDALLQPAEAGDAA